VALSDQITAFIRTVLEDTDGIAEIQRNELALKFNCAPSQINYVITTRFAPEQGYIIESRRGGGGYIRITRVMHDRHSLLMHALSAVGHTIDARSTAVFIQNLRHANALNPTQTAILLSVTSDNALRPVPQPLRDVARANIFKHGLLTTLE